LEHFLDNKTFIFIDSKQSSKVLQTVDTFGLYNELDKSVRGIARDENITVHYIKKLDDWSNHEVKTLNWLCKGIETKIPTEYRFLIKNINIAKYKEGVEMDFPHTNGSTIFISQPFINMIVKYYNNNDLNNCIHDIGSVIIHECVHIWQRREPNFFNKLFKKWNFTKYNKIINSRNFKNKNRYNPDGLYLNWCFTDKETNNEYLLLSPYKENAANIVHVNYIGIEVEKLGTIPIIPPIPNVKNLEDISYFKSFFGNVGNNNYHPNELSAEIISIIVINNMDIGHRKKEIPPAGVVFNSMFKQCNET
jgi:hypothetical protein